jgi:hypothetical protein
MRSKKSAILVIIVCSSALLVNSLDIDDDDFVDTSFSCPVKLNPKVGTCNQVCVIESADCPSELQCDSGLTLCVDGTCEASCSSGSENPCTEIGDLNTACYMEVTTVSSHARQFLILFHDI